MTDSVETEALVALTADLASAYLSHNKLASDDVGKLIGWIHAALKDLSAPPEAPAAAQEPAVPIRLSVKPDYIVCLEDGKKLKMLKRYLRTNFNMSPAEYRAKWGLKLDYPMVAPNYSEQRKSLALRSGLGRKKAQAGAGQQVVRRGRKPAGEASPRGTAAAKRRGRKPAVAVAE